MGMYGLVWGQVALSVIALFINTYYTGAFLNYNIFEQLKDLCPSILVSALVGFFLWLLDKNILYSQQDIIRLVIITSLYLIIYLGIAYVLKFKELILIKNLISKDDTSYETFSSSTRRV